MKRKKPDPAAVLRRAGPFDITVEGDWCIRIHPNVAWHEDYLHLPMARRLRMRILAKAVGAVLNAPRGRRR